MTMPSLPPVDSEDWYAHYAALDAKARVAITVDDSPILLRKYVTGNGTADDTSGLVAAATEAKTKKKVLVGGPELTIKLTAPVDLRHLDMVIESSIVIAHTTVPYGIQVGGSSNNTISRRVRLASVKNSTTSPAIPSVRVIGSKNGSYEIDGCDYVRLYANADPSVSVTDGSIAYNTFRFGRKINKLELFGENGPGVDGNYGWVNENIFINGSFDLIEFGGNYPHNSNIFLKPCVEGGAINVIKGTANRMISARFEQGTDIHFYAGTHSNVFEDSFKSNADGLGTIADVTDDNGAGSNNIVRGVFQGELKPIELVTIDRNTRAFNSTAEFAPASGTLVPGLQKLRVRTANADVWDSGLIPVEMATPGALAKEIKTRVEQFAYSSDATIWRPYVEVYDANRVRLSTTAGGHISTNGGWATALTGTAYGLSTVSTAGRIRITSADVKYVRLRFQSSLTPSTTAFNYLQVDAYVQSGSLPNAANSALRTSRRPLYQAAKPTEGVAQLGEMVAGPAGGWQCTARAETTLSAAAATNATSLTVTSATGIAVGDAVGILLDNGETHWTTISTVSGSTLTIPSTGIPSAAAIGRTVATTRWTAMAAPNTTGLTAVADDSPVVSSMWTVMSGRPYSITTTTTSVAKDVWRFTPCRLSAATNLTGLTVETTVAASGGTATGTLAVHSVGSDGRPGALLFTLPTTVDLTAVAAPLPITFASTQFPAGEFFLSFGWTGTATTAPTMRAIASTHPRIIDAAAGVTSRSGYLLGASGASAPASPTVSTTATLGLVHFGKHA